MKKQIQVNVSCCRIDKFLQQELGLSRQYIKKCIQEGNVTVKNKRVKPSFLVSEGDIIHFNRHEKLTEPSLSEPLFDIEYLYEDDEVVVLNKSVGCVVHPGDSTTELTLVDYLSNQGISLSLLGSPERPGVVHRLDRMTEGLMVFAKSDDALVSLKQQFKDRQVVKRYYAMVKGDVQPDFFKIDRPIKRHSRFRHKMCVHPDGKPSMTDVSVLKRFNTKTLCDVTLITGRTHQIRVHLSYIGYPLIDDAVYGVESKGKGQRLQAYFLSFFHPKSGVKYTFELPMSKRL